MHKKISAGLTVTVLAVVSCKMDSGNPQYNRGAHQVKGQAAVDPSDDQEAVNQYLADMLLADDAGTATAVVHVSASVAPDIEAGRLTKMSERLFTAADSDKSGALSLVEFLAGAEKLAKQFKDRRMDSVSDAQKEKVKQKITADFEEFAGVDAQMTVDELKEFLTFQAPRISKFRQNQGGRHGGQAHRQLPPPSWDQLMKKYDKNGDGSLSKDEFDAFMGDRRHRPQRPE
jgi:Ca2+-binding EF-hand superfamily protein